MKWVLGLFPNFLKCKNVHKWDPFVEKTEKKCRRHTNTQSQDFKIRRFFFQPSSSPPPLHDKAATQLEPTKVDLSLKA